MKFVLMCLLLLVGLNQIVARFIPYFGYESDYLFNNNDEYSNPYISGFDKFDIDDSSEESKEIQVHVPALKPDHDIFESLFNGLMSPIGFGVVTPGREGFTHYDDYNDDIETEEKKSTEEAPKEEVKEEGVKEEDEEADEEENEVNLEGSESTEVKLNKKVEEEIANNFFSALIVPFVLGEIMSDIDDSKKMDSSSEFSSEYMKESESSEEKTLDNSMIDETAPITNSYGENNIDDDENVSVKEIEDLLTLLTNLRAEDIGNKSHNKYTDVEILEKLLNEHIITGVNLAVDKFLEYDSDERTTTRVSINDEDEEDDNNDVLTTTKKNDSDEYDYNSIEYDERNEFSTTTESNSSEDYKKKNYYRPSVSKIDSDNEEDDDQSDDRTTKTRNTVEEEDDELKFIPMDFYGISDVDSQKNLNNQKYEIVTSSDTDHAPPTTSVPFSSDDHKLFREYIDLSKNLDNQQSSLLKDEVKLREDFLDIINTHYDDDSLNKFENDIRVLHGSLDKVKGYINAMENLHSKIYLRKLITAAIEEVQDKSKK